MSDMAGCAARVCGRAQRFAGANFTAGGRELLRVGLGKPTSRFGETERELPRYKTEMLKLKS
jgi:hypothetical protein